MDGESKQKFDVTDEMAKRVSERFWDFHKAWRFTYHLSPDVIKSILAEELNA